MAGFCTTIPEVTASAPVFPDEFEVSVSVDSPLAVNTPAPSPTPLATIPEFTVNVPALPEVKDVKLKAEEPFVLLLALAVIPRLFALMKLARLDAVIESLLE